MRRTARYGLLLGLLLGMASPALVQADGQQISGTCNTISWTANTESDLAGYKLYDRISLTNTRTLIGTYGLQINSVACNTLAFNAGQHYVSLTAFDTSGNESQPSADQAFIIVQDNQVSDLRVTVVNATDMTLTFSEVQDGLGSPSNYVVRFATPTINWGSALDVSSGTCATPVVGTTIGASKSCTVTGLSATTDYQFQLVPYHGTLGSTAVYSPLSNITGATTGGSVPGSVTRTTMIAESFTSANAGDLGVNWAIIFNFPWAIASNLIQAASATSSAVAIEMHKTVLPNAQWAQVTLTTIAGAADIYECVVLRASLTTYTGYEFCAAKGTKAGSAISKYVNGAFVKTIANETATAWAAGQSLIAEADGPTLKLSKVVAGVETLLLTGDDADFVSGFAGLLGYLGSATIANMQLDDFKAGTFLITASDRCGCDAH